jgi:hypothetical protein
MPALRPVLRPAAPGSLEALPVAAVVSAGRLLPVVLPLMLLLAELPLGFFAVVSPMGPVLLGSALLEGAGAEGSVLLWVAPVCAEAMPIVPNTAKTAGTRYFVTFMIHFS